MKCSVRCVQHTQLRSTGVVPRFLTLKGRAAWKSARRQPVCGAYKLEWAKENTIVLHGPNHPVPVAYVVGVQCADQGTVAVTQQVEQSLRQLQTQQQGGSLLVLLDPALTTAVAASSANSNSSSSGTGSPSAAAACLQQQLADLIAEYGGQLQLLTQQQQQQQWPSQDVTPETAVARSTAAVSKADTSSSSSVSSLLLSGLGQAGRAAAAAASTAAAAVLDVVEGAAAVTSAAVLAYAQRGVDVAADVPDMSLRPSAARDWRRSPEDSQFSWQAALIFCVLLIQLEKAGFDFVLTNDDDDDSDASTRSLDGSDSDSDNDSDDEDSGSIEERVMEALMQRGDIPPGSVVNVISNADGNIEVQVISPGSDIMPGQGSGQSLIPEEVDRMAEVQRMLNMTPEMHARGIQEMARMISSGEIRVSVGDDSSLVQEMQGSDISDQDKGSPPTAAEDGGDDDAAACGDSDASEGDKGSEDGVDFKVLGMFVTDEGQPVLLGVDDQAKIQVKKQQLSDLANSSTSSRESSKKGTKPASVASADSSSLSLDSFLQAGQLPLTADSDHPGSTNSSELGKVDSESTSNSSSSSSTEQASTTDSAEDNAAAATSDNKDSDDGESTPQSLSSSDSINLFKKEFRHRVAVAQGGTSSSKAAQDSSSSSSEQGQQDGDKDDSTNDGEDGQDLTDHDVVDDESDSDRWVLLSDKPEMLAAMLQLERSWKSESADRQPESNSTESSSSESSSDSSSSSNEAKEGEKNGADSKQSPAESTSAVAAAESVPLPELLPKPIRPQQDEDSSSSEGPSSSSSSSSSSKQGGLTPQEAAEVQAMMDERAAAAAAADAEQSSDSAKQPADGSQVGKQQLKGAVAAADDASKQQEPPGSITASSGPSDSESDDDEGVDVVELFHDFERKLEAEGIKLDDNQKFKLFAELFGEDSDEDDDSDDDVAAAEDDDSDHDSDDDSSSEESTATAAADKDTDSDSSSSESTMAVGGIIRSSRAKVGSSSSSSKSPSGPSSAAGNAPSGPGWDQLSRLIPSDQLSKLPDLLKSGNVRLSGLSPVEVSMIISGIARLQKGEELDSQEIFILMRVINDAEITPEGQEPDPDAALKRRNKALRKQQQQARQGLHRTAAGRAGTLGYGVNIKDSPYVQDTRSVRVPKAASRSRSEKVKQAIRQLRQKRLQQEMQLQQRRALQFARLQLQINMEAEIDDGDAASSSSSSSGRRGESSLQQQGSSDSSSSDSGWRGGFRKLRAAFSKASPVGPQQQQQQQEGVSAAVRPLGTAEAELQQQQQQQQLRAKGVQLVRQLQEAAGKADTAAGVEGVAAPAGRVVVAVVANDLLQFVEQEWIRSAQ